MKTLVAVLTLSFGTAAFAADAAKTCKADGTVCTAADKGCDAKNCKPAAASPAPAAPKK